MKEQFYQTMVKNLMKKNNFINLSWLLDKGQMTEDDYQVEIDTNPDLYIIDLNGDVNEEVLDCVNIILGELNIQLNGDEVAELFSLNHESLMSLLQQYQVETEDSEEDANID